GTLCDDPEVKKFLTTYKGRVSLGITIDGNQTLHDACRRYPNGDPSYDIVASAVHMCQKKYGVSNVTKLTLAPENVAYLYDAIMNLYNEFDFSGVYANCVYEDGWTNAHALTLYEQMKKLSDWMIDNDTYKTFYCTLYSDNIGQPMDENNDENWCGGTGAMLCFTTDGNITPCLRYTQFNLNDKQPEIRIGNLDTGIANEKCDRATMDGLDKITRRSQSTDECFSCPIASGCAWCSAFCYEETGTPNKRVTYICPMHKARVMSNVYFWNKLYRKLGMDDRFECHIPKEWALEIIPEDEYKMLLELASDDKL
ncbi:MAG: radical SAM protein, partial [Clostridia bacterium]